MGGSLYQFPEIGALLGSSTLTGTSSVALGWDGIAVERHVIPIMELAEHSLNQHFLFLWNGQVALGESERSPGKFLPYKKLPYTITTCPPGIFPAKRTADRTELTRPASMPGRAG